MLNYEKAYFILDEFLLAGEVQETSKHEILDAVHQQDQMQTVRCCGELLFLAFFRRK